MYTTTRQLLIETQDYPTDEMIVIGISLCLGINGYNKNYPAGQAWLWIAATFRRSFIAQYNWAMSWTPNPEFDFNDDISVAELEKRAATNDLAALYMLGVYYTEIDPALAVSYYQQAASQNFYPAINNLADKYETGVGIEQDLKKAFQMYHIAAEQHIAAAQWSLALMYSHGKVIKQDSVIAKYWAQRALENGWLPAVTFLAEIEEQIIH